jgi:phage recombination protein Bet
MTTEVNLATRVTFSKPQIDLIKRTICRGADDDELELFLYQCKRTGLDPMNKQIYALRRWDKELGREKMDIQTGIDGYRLIAERTGKYRGQLPVMWCGTDGEWRDVWLDDKPPWAAKATVLHTEKEPTTFVAYYKGFVQMVRNKDTKQEQPNRMWSKMPELMLAKCAESAALRKAFPHELSGLYTTEEMGQSDYVDADPPPPALTPAKDKPKGKVQGHDWETLKLELDNLFEHPAWDNPPMSKQKEDVLAKLPSKPVKWLADCVQHAKEAIAKWENQQEREPGSDDDAFSPQNLQAEADARYPDKHKVGD